MKQIHLIMPFWRHNLKDILIEAYKPMGIIWHVVMFQDEATEFNESWIFPTIIPMDSKEFTGILPWGFKRNYFIQNCEINDDDYYVTVDDDDMYELEVFGAIKQMDDDIVIISMKRGQHIPADAGLTRRYPTTTLIASPDNMMFGSISTQQSFVKGRIFKNHLYDDLGPGEDCRMAMHHKEDGEQIRYEPHLFALFNYYEPGRWKKPDIAFGVLVNDIVRLDMVLRQSAIQGNMHYIKDAESATKGLNKLLGIMEGEGATIAVLCHQDMYFRQGWLTQVREQLAKLPESWVVAGIVGKDMQGRICGKFHDTRIPQRFNTSNIHEFPQPACCLDECCIIVNLKKRFRFDETMDGFDLYGTLCVLQAWDMGGTAWVIDAFAEHYCLRPFSWFPDKKFKKNYKWLHNKYNKMMRIDSTAIGMPKDARFETSAAA